MGVSSILRRRAEWEARKRIPPQFKPVVRNSEKLRKDVAAVRMFIRSASAIWCNPEVLLPSSTMAQKRLLGRTISEDNRWISDIRTVNIFATNGYYRKMSLPNVQLLEKKIVGMLRRRVP